MGMWNLNSIYGEKRDESVIIIDKRENEIWIIRFSEKKVLKECLLRKN